MGVDRSADFTEAAVGTPHRFTQDYKSLDFNDRRPIRRLPWFIVGVGVPLVCVALILPRSPSLPGEPEPAAQIQSVAIDTRPAAEVATVADDDVAPAIDTESAPLPVAEPPGNNLTLKVRKSDSLDRLFKRHGLSRTDLANIMTLDSARKYLRLVKPEIGRAHV